MAKKDPNNQERHPIHKTLSETLPPPIVEEIDNGGGNSTTFIGHAELGTKTSEAKWKILRQTITVNGSATTTIIEFADGDVLYDNVFDDRASLKYSR